MMTIEELHEKLEEYGNVKSIEDLAMCTEKYGRQGTFCYFNFNTQEERGRFELENYDDCDHGYWRMSCRSSIRVKQPTNIVRFVGDGHPIPKKDYAAYMKNRSY